MVMPTQYCNPLGIGLHVCTYADEIGDGVFCGERCNQITYTPEEMSILYAVLNGRPKTIISRKLVLRVNGVPASTITVGNGIENFMHYWLIDEKYVGMLSVTYVENGLDYWRRDFTRGTCVIPPPRQLSADRLINNLKKIRGEA